MARVAALWHRVPSNFEEQLDAVRGHVAEFHFDDGYDDINDVADILEARGLRGVFFIVPGWLGMDGQATDNDVRDLFLRGHEIGNHTMHHVLMSRVPTAVQQAEWRGAQIALCDITGRMPERFAWPYGQAGDVIISETPVRGIGPDEIYAPRDRSAWEVHKAAQQFARRGHDATDAA